jgi:hypothetical protein
MLSNTSLRATRELPAFDDVKVARPGHHYTDIEEAIRLYMGESDTSEVEALRDASLATTQEMPALDTVILCAESAS